jgi:predicted permease
MPRLFRRLQSLLHRHRLEQDLQDELAAHVAMDAEERIETGESPEAAQRAARRDFGNVALATEDARATWGWTGLEQFVHDLRHGARLLLRRPAFTITATLTLALGTGATASVFALIDTVLVRRLPVHRPDELAHIYTSCQAGEPYCWSSYPLYLDYRAQSRTFADIAAFDPIDISVGDNSGTWVGTALLVSTNYFTLLGIPPHAGQLISPAWNTAADPPVVLAYDTWMARFGGDRSVIGRPLRVSGATFRIAGVVPLGFHSTKLHERPDMWLAMDNISLMPHEPSDMLTNRGRQWIGGTIGRLRPGATIEQARADMRAISEKLQQSGTEPPDQFATVEPAAHAALPPTAASDIRRFLALLMGVVGAALLIACANVAGLLLARGAARRPEIELRRALGAARGRLVRQLASEHLLLAVLGTALGMLLARASMALMVSYRLPGSVPIASLDLQLDTRVLAFALVLLAVTGLFGLIPALGTTRGVAAMAASRITSDTTGPARGQILLLAVQMAMTVILLVAAGLFIRSLQNGLSLDVGLSSRSVVMAQLVPALERYPAARTQAIVDEALARLRSLPDIEAATAARRPPLTNGDGFSAQEIEGYSPSPGERMRFESNFVAPAYFEVLHIGLRAGREFTSADRENAPLVGIVNETMARRYWPGRDPIDAHVRSRSFPRPIQIVGVVDDVTVGLDDAAGPFVYLPLAQHPRFLNSPRPIVVLARARSNSAALAGSMRRVVHGVDPTVPIGEVTALDDRIAELLMPQRLGTALLSALGGLTTVLVIVGAAGTVAYAVSRRRREIAVRLALGAHREQVAVAMTHHALLSLAGGLSAGIVGAVAFGRLASRFLYGIEPTDPASFAVAAAVLGLVTGVAAFVPAWRAARMDPGSILKAE